MQPVCDLTKKWLIWSFYLQLAADSGYGQKSSKKPSPSLSTVKNIFCKLPYLRAVITPKVLDHVLVFFGHKVDRRALPTEPAWPPNAMNVALPIGWHVKVDDKCHLRTENKKAFSINELHETKVYQLCSKRSYLNNKRIVFYTVYL